MSVDLTLFSHLLDSAMLLMSEKLNNITTGQYMYMYMFNAVLQIRISASMFIKDWI